MKFNAFATIVISLCLAGEASARINIEPIIPKLEHQKFDIVNEETQRSLGISVNGIPGVEVAKQFAVKKFGLVDGKDFIVKNTYISANGITHSYLKQLYKGKEVSNGDMNVNVDASGNVISYGSSFHDIKGKQGNLLAEKLGSSLDAVEALFNHLKVNLGIEKSKIAVKEARSADEPALLTNIPAAPKGVKAIANYIQIASGQLDLVWSLEVDLDENWINAYVTSNNKVVALYDWVHEASYDVWPIGVNDPEDGARKVVTEQGTVQTSPLGWHDQGNNKKFTTTVGNNIIAFDSRKSTLDWVNAPKPDGGANLKFEFPIDFTKDPSTYINGAVTNLFYNSNMIHDIYYAHGFNEVAGNFQQNNFDKGGKGGDPVLVQAQDGSGTPAGANFAIPPDGHIPRMKLYTWTRTTPNRDSDLDNGVIIHEYTHGLSVRLTGGPANSNCLNGVYSGGMGEGWGDAMAYVFRTRAEHTRNTDFGFGNYLNNGKTIRQYLYSTEFKVNPETFAAVNKYTIVQKIGAVWAEILYEVYWNLIDQAGFSVDLISGKHDHGNTLFLRLLIDGMKLQPCNPSIIQARDAIILAEKQLTNEKFKCAIWKGFAKRGLGTDAKFSGNKATDGNTVPEGC